jgi:cytosine/adenosine deaminase-related metal-dependent hydrolase
MSNIGERFTHVGTVPGKEDLLKDPRVRVFYGNGRTLIPGLGDAHTHLSWNGGDLGRLGELGVEEHTLLTARSARCFLDSGYTMYVLFHSSTCIPVVMMAESDTGASEPHQLKDD